MKHNIFIILVLLFLISCSSSKQQEQVYIPKDLQECCEQLDTLLSQDTKDSIKKMETKKEMIKYHFYLSFWMRNNWGLWRGSRLKEYFISMGITHPDDMSGIILECYYRQLHNQDWELDKQIKHYQDYWKAAKEHSLKMETDTAYRKEFQLKQKMQLDSIETEYLTKKKLAWKPGTAIIGYLDYRCGFISPFFADIFNLGINTEVKGTVIEWQDDNVVMKITQYIDEKKKKKVIKCNDIEDDIVIIHDHRMFRLEKQ